MLKEIQSGFGKFFTRDKVFILIALIILGYALYSYSDSKFMVRDNMELGSQQKKEPTIAQVPAQLPPSPAAQTEGYTPQQTAAPSDLLPVDQNSQWAALNPVSMNQGNITMPDLLQAGYHIGLDTIGQTLRNANQQLRSDPIIPKANVGPWNQSTIEPDYGRTPLEIGGKC
jgi:hypothetical protein